MTTEWSKESYLSLSTRKRDGSRVETPVWFAKEGNLFYLFSEGKAGKVKRIRNFSDVYMSPCTVTGKITGDKIDGTARILNETEAHTAYKALKKKYGFQMLMIDIGATIARKKHKRAFIEVKT